MTAIYTCIPADIQTPEQAARYRHELHTALTRALRTSQQRYHEPYTALPYTMEDLPGTTWRNIHTADVHTVNTIGIDRWNKPGPDLHYSMFSIGCYRDEQFQIDTWIRTDTLPPQFQLDWAAERVRTCKEDLRTHKQAKTSPAVYKINVTWHQDYLDQALRQLHDVTRQHQLPPIDPTTIALPGEQLSLFV